MSVAETANAISSLIKTVLGSLLIGAIGYGGGWLYMHFAPDVQLRQKEHELQQVRASLTTAHEQLADQDHKIRQLGQDLESSRRRIVQLDTSLRLLKVDRRVAEVVVLRQQHSSESGQLVTEFEFQEINGQGTPIEVPRRFEITGDLLYVDFWIVKFQDELVEQADTHRATSLCLFRRLFGEHQEPYEGFVLDEEGTRPSVYGGGGVTSEFEREIWADFWTLANDPARAAAMGIRAAHGQAVSTRLRPGRRYRVTLRASDGLTIVPVAKG